MIPISDKKQRSCVACGKELDLNDDVVVCPDCGAPHHRTCWQENGHCYYHLAHGTDLQWHPKQEAAEEQPEQPTDDATHQQPRQPFVFVNGRPMTRCSGCGRFVPTGHGNHLCPHCGTPLQAAPHAGPLPIDFGEPIDGVQAEKVARIVLQRNEYYLPRFRILKKQGRGVCSWNWAACLFTPYWFAFRKCYLWSAFSLFFNALSTILYMPFVNHVMTMVPADTATYSQILDAVSQADPTSGVALWALAGTLVLVLRGLLFGLLGNYIYKKECLKRIEQLDGMQPSDAANAVFKLGGLSIFAPLIAFYANSLIENIIMRLI